MLASSLIGSVTIPIYQGGAEYATIRQSKETLGQQELQTDQQRDVVRALVVAAWGSNQNSLGIVRASKAQVDAAEVALAGVREEAKVGQRTTLDVLNAQQTLLQARVQLVSAQHDQVVNSYNLFAAIGRLSITTPGPLRSRNTIRGCISIRSRTNGSACARPTASSARVRKCVNKARRATIASAVPLRMQLS